MSNTMIYQRAPIIHSYVVKFCKALAGDINLWAMEIAEIEKNYEISFNLW
jgi:hypothetical protein